MSSFFALNGSSDSSSNAHNGVKGGQIVVVPVVKATYGPQYTNNHLCYIQQPAVRRHNFLAQQYNWPNVETGAFYYSYY